MSRRIARENTFKLIFEYLFTGEENEISFEVALSVCEEKERTYMTSLYKSILINYKNIESLISRYSRDFSFDRIYKVDLAILYLSIAEIFYLDIPLEVSINEAIELTKKYSTEKSPSYVNGVLSGVISQLGENNGENIGRDKASTNN